MDLPKLPKIDTFVPSKADLEHCPLCLKKWAIFEEPGKEGKVYFFCIKDLISIWIRDPMLGRWRIVQKEPCPVCGEKEMRLFFRSDEYIKMLCHKCGCCIENVDPAKHAALMKKEESMGIRHTPKIPPKNRLIE